MLSNTEKELLEKINDFDTMIEMASGQMREMLLIQRAVCVDKLGFDTYVKYMNVATEHLNFELN